MDKLKCISLIIFLTFSLKINSGETENIDCFDEKKSNHFFSDILLIINYNHPYYMSIDFLKEIYSPVFPNIVFYGEQDHPEVFTIKHYFGWYGHNVIDDAMKRWPDFKGYLCLQDDCFMNFWNFEQLDLEKIWASFPADRISLNTVTHPWPWWNMFCGREAILQSLTSLSEDHRKMLSKNIGVDEVAVTYHDFVYIPGRHRQTFIELYPHFSHVFVELALTNILLCLDNINNREYLNSEWGISNIMLEFDPSLDWIHPVKFSSIENQKFIRSVLQKMNVPK